MSKRTQLDVRPQLLTRADAAAYLQLSRGTFSAWLRRGFIPGPVEGTNRYDQKALDAAMEELSAGFDGWLCVRRARHGAKPRILVEKINGRGPRPGSKEN